MELHHLFLVPQTQTPTKPLPPAYPSPPRFSRYGTQPKPALVAKVVKIFRSQASLALKDAGKDLQAMQRAGQAEAMPWQQQKTFSFCCM